MILQCFVMNDRSLIQLEFNGNNILDGYIVTLHKNEYFEVRFLKISVIWQYILLTVILRWNNPEEIIQSSWSLIIVNNTKILYCIFINFQYKLYIIKMEISLIQDKI